MLRWIEPRSNHRIAPVAVTPRRGSEEWWSSRQKVRKFYLRRYPTEHLRATSSKIE
jgi:hypothetical protein